MSQHLNLALSLTESGYQIIPIAPGGKNPALDDWRSYDADAAQVRRWWTRMPTANIGVNTTRTPAIDLDILDDDLAREMEAFVAGLLGDAPTRVGRAPKRLLVFSAPTPFRKVTSPFFVSPDGTRHRVEVLGEGQQFVAYGVHPDTQKPYEWISFEELKDLDAFDLPTLTHEQAQAVVDEFSRRAEARGWKRTGIAMNSGGTSSADPLSFLRPKLDVDDDELRTSLMALPNPGRDYDLWLQIGMSLHDHYDGDSTGLELWHLWSEQSELYDANATEYKWNSFGSYTGRKTTVAFILKYGREARAKQEIEEQLERVDDLKRMIASATSLDNLMRDVVAEIVKSRLEDFHREQMATMIQKRAKDFDAKLPIKDVRDALKGRKASNGGGGPTSLNLEVDLAKQVLAEHYENGRHLKYFSEIFWEYRGGVWRRAEMAIIQQHCMQTILRLQDDGDESLVRLAELMSESRGDRLDALTSTVASVLKKLVAEEGNDDPLNLLAKNVPRVMNCANAELWFESDGTMKVKRHDADHHLTSQIGCAYDPKATCPTWDAAVRKVFQTCDDVEEVVRHFEEVFGYILQPTRYQAIWVMLKGPGGNGKSFLLEVISTIMGSRAVAATSIANLAGRISSHFTDSLQGKLMLLDDDLKAGTLLPDDWLKKLSEAKLISADPKFAQAYTFTARSVPVMLTNPWPSTVDLSEGIRRRAIIFESKHILTDDEKNPQHMQQIIEHELPGVLNRLIEGFRRFLNRGQVFDTPPEVAQSLHRWSVQSNATARFVADALERTGNAHDFVPASRVYDAYKNWIHFHETNARELGRNKFYEALEALGLPRRNHSGLWMFGGVKLKRVEGIEDVFDALDPVDLDEGL